MIDAMSVIRGSAVIGVADADVGEAVIAVIVAQGEAPTAAEVIDYCKTQLANCKVPKRVEAIDALPRNAMGKVQKNLLRERFATTD